MYLASQMLKNPSASVKCKGHGFDPRVREIPWRRAWPPTPVFLPGGSPWTEEPGGLSPCGCKELDTTEATEHPWVYLLFSQREKGEGCWKWIVDFRIQPYLNFKLWGHIAVWLWSQIKNQTWLLLLIGCVTLSKLLFEPHFLLLWNKDGSNCLLDMKEWSKIITNYKLL